MLFSDMDCTLKISHAYFKNLFKAWFLKENFNLIEPRVAVNYDLTNKRSGKYWVA